MFTRHERAIHHRGGTVRHSGSRQGTTGKFRVLFLEEGKKMLNGKDVKLMKDVAVTEGPEGPVYSGGRVTFHDHEKNKVTITCYKCNKSQIISDWNGLIKCNHCGSTEKIKIDQLDSALYGYVP
ncbi:hypothetical protein [Klebsiella pneumoniae]|uniref:hypothetical protein n=1 Tax=Klebsiella pneumoniae TaxID=573 RepID=UPI001082E411|nr:hypothetical protein [Klebsiella pneumoniae]MCU8619967.1 hypothetical protein [Klebsiella pneumoniae]HBT3219994.1 hypothetical protein [Klebsiella pneumoniae]HBU9050927.1 hypothetical protein [Klebsiella pneumoniae]HBW9472304.1 hypothetical protein [Klebsiella pneumoniae]HCM5893395.1 hypothetical protein [Klebsiella pneumoniae]